MNKLKAPKNKGLKRLVPYYPSEISQRWAHLRTGKRIDQRTFVGTNITGTLHSLRKTTQTELEGLSIHPNLIDSLIGHGGQNVAAMYYSNYMRNIGVIRDALEKIAVNFIP